MIPASKLLPPVISQSFSKKLLTYPLPGIIAANTFTSKLGRTGGKYRMEKHFAVYGRKVRTHNGSKRIATLYNKWRMVLVDPPACCRGEFRRQCILGKKKCSRSEQ